MKKIDYLLPEMPYMVKLLKVMDKTTSTIASIKSKISRVDKIAGAVERIQQYNFARFTAIALYQDMCQNFYEDGKDVTCSLYQERLGEDALRACFLDEANCLSLIRDTKTQGWNLQPDSPEFGFNLNYYILETLGFGFGADFVRDCMDFFVPDNKVLSQYHKGVTNLFYKKKMAMAFSDDYKKSDYDDLLMSIHALFSMKCGPNDYIPLFEPVSIAEEEKLRENADARAKNKNGGNGNVLRMTQEDFARLGAKLSLNPQEKER